MNEPHIVPDSELDFDDDLVFTLNGVPFTGVAYEDSPTLGRSEITYKDGLQSGVARDWYPSGTLKGESYYYEGTPHGLSREYSSNGRLTEESRFEYGIRLYRRTFGPDGEIVESEELDPNSGSAELLERYRRQDNWPT